MRLAGGSWIARETPAKLRERYLAEGLWSDETLGELVAACLANGQGRGLRVWSATRPYSASLAEADLAARRLAGGLRRCGVGPGDRVAFQLPNWHEAAFAFWGVSMLGATLVPVVHFYGPKELAFILRQSEARVFVTADRFGHLDYLAGLDAIRPSLDSLETVVSVPFDPRSGAPAGRDEIPFGSLLEAEPIREPQPVDPGDPALIAYTSGTTAEPKGVVHTHRSLLAEVRHITGISSPDERSSLMGAPVGHAIGMLGGLFGPLASGRSINLTDVWEPRRVLAYMAEGDLCFSGGATYFLTSLIDAAEGRPEHLDRMRFAGLGGAPVPAAVSESARDLGITVMRSYGSTEHPSVTGSSYEDPEEKRLLTDGRPLPGVELAILDESGCRAAPGAPGVIHTRGPDLFAGYTDPVLTDRAFDADGWYSTGDVGVLDDDGYLRITDRVQDVIIRGGENISAAEVEELLMRMPGVAEAAVVAAPDERLGEHACAFIVLRPRAAEIGLGEIRAHLGAEGLARQKWPEEVRTVSELPRTPSSKVKKFELRARLRTERGLERS
jgi:acyl-CoA synthetase